MKEIDILNAKIEGKDTPVPYLLYKYRPLDDFALDMIENKYVFLSPAENLDDPSECSVDFNVRDFVDIHTNRLTQKGVNMILNYVKPHTTANNFLYVQDLIDNIMKPDGSFNGPDLLEAFFQMEEFMPEDKRVSLVNQLRAIPEKISEKEVRKELQKLFSLAHDARQCIGICSLTELQNSDEMWQNYADNHRGYCIEYDMKVYTYKYALFPVVYKDNRENNIINSILGTFIGEMICGISNGQISTDKSQFIRLFLTKDLKWDYQKEWRLLGDARQKLPAPTIKAIYLGKNMPEQERVKITECCKKFNIPVK